MSELQKNTANIFISEKKFFRNFDRVVCINLPHRLDRKINELELESNIKEHVKRILHGTLQIDPNKRWTIDDLSKEPFFMDN